MPFCRRRLLLGVLEGDDRGEVFVIFDAATPFIHGLYFFDHASLASARGRIGHAASPSPSSC